MAALLAPALAIAGLGLVSGNSQIEADEANRKLHPLHAEKPAQTPAPDSLRFLTDFQRTAKHRSWSSALVTLRKKLLETGRYNGKSMVLDEDLKKYLERLLPETSAASRAQIKDLLGLDTASFRQFLVASTRPNSEPDFISGTGSGAVNMKVRGDSNARSILKREIAAGSLRGKGEDGYDYDEPLSSRKGPVEKKEVVSEEKQPAAPESSTSSFLGSAWEAVAKVASGVKDGLEQAKAAKQASDDAKEVKQEELVGQRDEGMGPENIQPIADNTIPTASSANPVPPTQKEAILQAKATPVAPVSRPPTYTYFRLSRNKLRVVEPRMIEARMRLTQDEEPGEHDFSWLDAPHSDEMLMDKAQQMMPGILRLPTEEFNEKQGELPSLFDDVTKAFKSDYPYLADTGTTPEQMRDMLIPFSLGPDGKPVALPEDVRNSLLISKEESWFANKSPPSTPEEQQQRFDYAVNSRAREYAAKSHGSVYAIPFNEFRRRFPDQNFIDFQPIGQTVGPLMKSLYKHNPHLQDAEAGVSPEISQPMSGHGVGMYENGLPPLASANAPPEMTLDPSQRPYVDWGRVSAQTAWDVGLNAAQGIGALATAAIFGNNPAAAAVFSSVFSNLPATSRFLDQTRGYSEELGARIAQRVIHVIDTPTVPPAALETQILNPLQTQTVSDRVSTQVQDAFVRGSDSHARNGIDQGREAFQNWFRDANSPFAVY